MVTTKNADTNVVETMASIVWSLLAYAIFTCEGTRYFSLGWIYKDLKFKLVSEIEDVFSLIKGKI
jgi:hypothetical protein